MALTPSTMLPLGTLAPDFALPEVTEGRTVRLGDFSAAPALLVMFICKHCPYVIHVRDELARLGHNYVPRGVAIVAISSNDAEKYPEDALQKLAEMVREAGFNFPLCYDESQSIARAYDAACTPDFFLFDAARKLAYRGQLDDSRPSRGEANGRDLRAALEAVLAGQPVAAAQKPSVGCNIKWKPGLVL